MRKLLALTLVLLMALTAVSAAADTVYTKVTIDRGQVPTFGITEEQQGMIDPILALVNALGVKVTTVDDGAQIDLDLNETDLLSLGIAMDDAGLVAASTLFPNYVVTASQETIVQFMEQAAANVPAAGESGMDPNALMETYGGYFYQWFEACAAAGQPGEPQTVDFETSGYTFDTMVPVTVDMPVIIEATDALVDEILSDEAVVSMLQSSGSGFNSDEFKTGYEAFKANMPNEVKAEYYTSGENIDIAFIAADAFFEGQDEAQCHAELLNKGDNDGYLGFWDYRAEMIIGVEYSAEGFRADYTRGEDYFGISFLSEANEYDFDVYCMNSDAPLVCVKVTTAEGGERTLSMDAAGKNVLAVEGVTGGQGDAVQGLLGDIMANGMGALGVLTEQVPEIGGLMSMFTGDNAA